MLEQGMYVAERYEIIEKIGTGGMSDVFLAKDVILGRMVAIKVLKAEFSEDSSFVSKFRAEAQSAAGLEHPNIVNVYDVGVEDGLYYIVMEYVEGVTLKTYIEKKGQLNYKEAVSIAIQVGRGIEAAHSKGIIHRDIKPQNIMISTEGKVKVTDFGIARAATANTIHADVMGSVHYSSPEQARNGFVDCKSDIYSLGIVMYEMVTGRVPFDGESTVAIAIQHLQEEMVNPNRYASDLPISLEKIILKSTMKSPDRRYASITDLLNDLKKALISPNEDFVVILDSGLERTRIMTSAEQDSLTKAAGAALAESIEAEEMYARRGRDEDEYDDEDDDDLDPGMEKMFTILGIGAGVVIVAIIVVILGNIFGLFHFGDKANVEMIEVVGETEVVAQNLLDKLGLEEDDYKIIYKEDDSVGPGVVIEQSVKEGDKFNLNKDKLTLTVSKASKEAEAAAKEEKDNSEKVRVPNVLDTTEESAIKMLEDVGLSYTRSYQYDSKVASGKVISQSPAAGANAKAGEKITLVISQGKAGVQVPDVTGMSLDDAKDAMKKAGLKVTSTDEQYGDQPKGKVINQSVTAGKTVDEGTNVTLTVSKGKREYSYSYKVPNPDNIPKDKDGNDVQVEYTYTFSVGSTGTCKPGDTLKIDKGVFQDEITITLTWKEVKYKAAKTTTETVKVKDETTGEEKEETKTITTEYDEVFAGGTMGPITIKGTPIN